MVTDLNRYIVTSLNPSDTEEPWKSRKLQHQVQGELCTWTVGYFGGHLYDSLGRWLQYSWLGV